MAENEDSAGVDVLLAPQQSGGANGVDHGLAGHGEIGIGGALGGIDPCPLLVAQHGDAARGQAFGQIAKHLDAAYRLVAVIRAGAVDQNYGGEQAGPFGTSSVPGSLRGRTDGDLAPGEGVRLAIVRALPV